MEAESLELKAPGIMALDNLRMTKQQMAWQSHMLKEMGLSGRFSPSPYLARNIAVHFNVLEAQLTISTKTIEKMDKASISSIVIERKPVLRRIRNFLIGVFSRGKYAD